MRPNHYWKLAGAKCAPSNIIVYDTETWHGDKAQCEGGEFQTLRLGCAMAYRLEKGQRTRQRRITFTDATDFFELLRSRLDKRRPLWVFAHNASFDAGIVGLWEFLRASGATTEKAAMSGTLFFLKCHIDGLPVTFADTCNYYHCSLAALGKSVGIPKGEMPEQSAPDGHWADYCANDVEVTAAGLDALIAFNRKERLGPWQPSIAGLAFSAYRAAFMRHKVLVHNDARCLKLERGCYYGGLVETPRVGRVPAREVYELDVCSMYPSVCQLPLPYHKLGYSERIGPEVVAKLRKSGYMLAAEVTIETPEPYPVRLKNGTYHATGRFVTALAHPELIQAIDAGAVKWFHKLAWYRAAPVAAEYMRHFVTRKTEYKREGNAAFETLCKYFANSLYGKWGQLSPKWTEYGAAALTELEERYGLPEGTLSAKYATPPHLYSPEAFRIFREIPDAIPLRDYYGICEIKTGEFESRDSAPIMAATVTSYSRLLLRSYQKCAGRDHWFYCDTDSVWCDKIGYERLFAAGHVRQDELGFLSLKHVHAYLDVYGPKDYETDRVRRMKGIRPTAEYFPGLGWQQLQFPSAGAQLKAGYHRGVFVASVMKKLKRELTKCVLMPNGRTRPLSFPEENPDRPKPRKAKRGRART